MEITNVQKTDFHTYCDVIGHENITWAKRLGYMPGYVNIYFKDGSKDGAKWKGNFLLTIENYLANADRN